MKCPLLGKKCIEHECAFWGEFAIQEKVSQEIRVEKGCSVARIPRMLIELISATVGTKSATEQVRNRVEHVVRNTGHDASVFASLAELAIRGNGKRKELDDGDST